MRNIDAEGVTRALIHLLFPIWSVREVLLLGKLSVEAP